MKVSMCGHVCGGQRFPPSILRQGLSLSLEIMDLARLVGNEPQGCSSLSLPGAGITNTDLDFLFLKVGHEDWTLFSHFPNRATPQPLPASIFRTLTSELH